MKGTFFRGALLGGIVGVLAAGVTVAVAGSGIGAAFNLGQTNTVNAQSVLTGSTSNPQLRVQNSGGGRGIAAYSTSAEGAYGESVGGNAVTAESTAATGAMGRSNTTTGVLGDSATGDGVTALSHSATSAGAYGFDSGDNGVFGRVAGGYGAAVKGTAADGRGVMGSSSSAPGVTGTSSQSAAAVIGESSGFDGVFGITHVGFAAPTAAGVTGMGTATGNGVYGEGKIGVHAETSDPYGVALDADGNVKQNGSSNGWIKAMAYIDTSQAQKVRRCFNSLVSPAVAATPTCGITIKQPPGSIGDYHVDFGAAVYNRPVSVTPVEDGGDIAADVVPGANGNEWQVRTFYSASNDDNDDAQKTFAPFYIVVY